MGFRRGGGYVTREERYRARYLLFTTVSYEQAEENPASVPVDSPRTGKGRLLARYAVRLNDEGELAEYRLLKDGQQADAAETAWYAYLEIEKESPWFNNQTYVNTLDKKAIERFVEITHERYKEVVGNEFGGAVQSIFSDEPQFS